MARNPNAGTAEFRIFTVSAGAEVGISGIGISQGYEAHGGGVLNGGTLTMTDCVVRGNTAVFSGGGGGGVYNDGGTLTIERCLIEQNTAGTADNGGGLYDSGGTVTIRDSTIRNNQAGFNGGGMLISGSAGATITGSTISGNRSSFGGGGIYNGSTMEITNSTISGNSVDMSGGGAVWNTEKLTIIDSTIAGNLEGLETPNVGEHVGGIDNIGLLRIQGSVFSNPSGGNLETRGGTTVSLGHNLFSDGPSITLGPSDLVNTDPLLGPLEDNGGPTFTQALLPGSPAIDAGVGVSGVTTDQRGVARPQGSAADIGAFESRGFTVSIVSGGNQSTATGMAFALWW